MSQSYILYSSDGCHLCEEALAICLPLLAETLTVIDIVEDENLVKLYGVHIPVLERTDITHTDNKLFWPFNLEQVKQLHKITHSIKEKS
ncbi:MAG: glutaredoxin family protein [Thalassotalea sp.]